MVNPITTTWFRMEHQEIGVIRIEQWPEGIVLWAGGEIRWQSWITVKLKRRDAGMVTFIDGKNVEDFSKEEIVAAYKTLWKMTFGKEKETA